MGLIAYNKRIGRSLTRNIQELRLAEELFSLVHSFACTMIWVYYVGVKFNLQSRDYLYHFLHCQFVLYSGVNRLSSLLDHSSGKIRCRGFHSDDSLCQNAQNHSERRYHAGRLLGCSLSRNTKVTFPCIYSFWQLTTFCMFLFILIMDHWSSHEFPLSGWTR